MRPDTLRRQRGFGLVAALFVIIVITLVIAAMARLSTTQHGSNSLALQQARAYQAARAGLECRHCPCLGPGALQLTGQLGGVVVVQQQFCLYVRTAYVRAPGQ